MRNSIDSVSPAAIIDEISASGVDRRGLMAGVYANGKFKANEGQVSTLKQSGVQVFHIDVDGTAAEAAAVLDFEKGDVQRASTVTNWVRFRGEHYGDPVVYCNRSSLATVIPAAAAAGQSCGLWVADLLDSPPLDPGLLQIALPVNLWLLGCQYKFDPAGRNVDLSIMWHDGWHPAPESASRPNADIVNAAWSLLGRRTAAENEDMSTPDPAAPADPTSLLPAPDPIPAPADPASPDPSAFPPSSPTDGAAPDGGSSPDPATPPAVPTPSPLPGTSEPSDPSSSGAPAPSPDPIPTTPAPSSSSTPPSPSSGTGDGTPAQKAENLIHRLEDGVKEAVSVLKQGAAEKVAEDLEDAISTAAAVVRAFAHLI